MSFIGKEYIYDSNEGVEELLKTLGKGLPEDLKEYNMKVKTTKDGDTYTIYAERPSGVKKTVFQNGVEFDEEIRGRSCKTTVTVDGNTMSMKRKFEKGTFIIDAEYVDDKMIATVSVEGLGSLATVTFKQV